MNKVWMLFIGLFVLSCAETAEQSEQVIDESGKLVEGVSRNFYENGKLRNEVPVKEGKRHGLAKEYYENGNLAAAIEYKNDLKEGLSQWFYQDGILYQEAQYQNNKKHGIEKKFYNTGELMAELKWKEGEALPGLVEYQQNGKEIKQPTIEVSGRGTVKIRLSNGARNVQFYRGEMADDEPLNTDKHIALDTYEGVATVSLNQEPLHIIAVRRSNMKNPQILRMTYQP